MNKHACRKSGHAFFPFQAGASVFVHLHCHSHYSFLRGVASPEEIIASAVEQKMPAVALTDTNGLYAAVKFYKLALEARIKPIVGVTLDVVVLIFENVIPSGGPQAFFSPGCKKSHFCLM